MPVSSCHACKRTCCTCDLDETARQCADVHTSRAACPVKHQHHAPQPQDTSLSSRHLTIPVPAAGAVSVMARSDSLAARLQQRYPLLQHDSSPAHHVQQRSRFSAPSPATSGELEADLQRDGASAFVDASQAAQQPQQRSRFSEPSPAASGELQAQLQDDKVSVSTAACSPAQQPGQHSRLSAPSPTASGQLHTEPQHEDTCMAAAVALAAQQPQRSRLSEPALMASIPLENQMPAAAPGSAASAFRSRLQAATGQQVRCSRLTCAAS